jgi:hypothetical protein
METLKALNLKRIISFVLMLSLLFIFTSCTVNNESISNVNNSTPADTNNTAESKSNTPADNNETTAAEISTSTAIVTNLETTEGTTEEAAQLDIAGMWQDKDGTTRIFSSDGICQNVAKIDIGGPPPVYTISEKPDNNGYYLLFVSQSGYNQTTFYVKVINRDEIKIYENPNAVEALYNLTRM